MKQELHIQTYPPHFKYAKNLISALHEYTEDVNFYDIFIFFDTSDDMNTFKNEYSETSWTNTYYKSLEDVLGDKFEYMKYNENYIDSHNNIANGNSAFDFWGSGFNHNRKWFNIKRVYGILDMERMGYSHVWCIDSESYPLKKFNISDIFKHNLEKDILSVSKKGGWNDDRISTLIFKYDPEDPITKKVMQCGVRINDFWIINTGIFKSMIIELMKKHDNPVSYFILGCEQAAYEIYMYHNHLKGNIDIDCIDFSDDIFDGILEVSTYSKEADCFLSDFLVDVFNNPEIDHLKFIRKINEIYFNKTLSYRGDRINLLEFNPLYRELNIKFKVSNAQN